MSIIALVVVLLVVCVIEYVLNQSVPGLIQPEAHRLIWLFITVVVIVVLLVWALEMFGVSSGGAWSWWPHLRLNRGFLR